MNRLVWLVLGCLMVGLGVVGALLPVMPTTIFLILAAGCFARSSPALEARLLNHARYGPALRAWSEERAISARGKRYATLGMAVGAACFWVTARPSWPVGTGVTSAMGLCALWIQTRPLPRVERRTRDRRELAAKIVAFSVSWGGHALAVLLLFAHRQAPPKPVANEQIRVQLTFLAPAAPPVPTTETIAPERPEETRTESRAERPAAKVSKAPVLDAPLAHSQPTPRSIDAPVPGEDSSRAARVSTPTLASAPRSLSLPPSPQMRGAIDPDWEGDVLTRLETFKRYPRPAKVRRQEGIVLVRALIDGTGHVLSTEVQRSSGSDLLDREALATFARAEPLPAPPATTMAPVELEVPVRFFLH